MNRYLTVKLKKVLFLIFVFLLANFDKSYAQKNVSGQLVYVATTTPINVPDSINGKKISEKERKRFMSLIDNSDKVFCNLFFKNGVSTFEKVTKLEKENPKLPLVSILIGNGVYYTDIEKKEILNQKNSLGELFLVKHEFFKWQLTQETKKIGNYICYKAIGYKTVENKKGVSKNLVEAWYTREIQLPYGPKEFSGLPGLIVSIKEGRLIMNLEKVLINPKREISIKKPKKGIKVSLEEFNRISKKAFSELKRKKH